MSNSKLITISQCRDLRMTMTELTHGCILTEDEYRQFCVVINKVLNRLEKEEKQNGTI